MSLTSSTPYRDRPLVSISDAQRSPVADLPLRWAATIHHGLDLKETYRLGYMDGPRQARAQGSAGVSRAPAAGYRTVRGAARVSRLAIFEWR
jgi:hypothetical protein